MSTHTEAEKVRHTPGPWIWRNEDGDVVDLCTWRPTGYSNNLCLCGPAFKRRVEDWCNFVEEHDMVIGCSEYVIFPNWPSERAEANARLIAAAPELLEALKVLMERCEISENDPSDAGRVIEAARAAIAKAEGNA